ncbi:uncharacterized protein LOC118742634 isoform X2 [Rhagoletis pomonella]|uniref:uncharacterized protein LOC118742634 isoform X2 n=1 Tax=Rhagoletis pomonella TaxID=28610 RepID=UPI00177E2A17|nr:uncharacterized protein LOC118742634 isoform X2 [Rhagoletis pomonella]
MSNKRKLEIELDLKSNDKRYSFFTPTSVRSSVWKHFQPFRNILHTKNIATSDTLYIRNNSESCNLYHIHTRGDGFRKFAQALINIGAEYGKQNVEEILVTRPILINSLIPTEYFNIKNQLEYILSNNQVNFSTATLIDECSKRSFLTLTAHYINDDFILKSSLLGTREFTSSAVETSARINYFVMDILNEFQIKDKLNQGMIVTENSTTFIEAFRTYKRISCVCHNITLFMKDALDNSTIKEVKELIEASRCLVSLYENSELNNILSIPEKPKETEKFSSVYRTLSSIFTMYNEIEQALMERNEWQEIADINFHLLDRVISFFRPFKECFDILSSQTSPVIAEYCLWYDKLQKFCFDCPRDSDVISELKAIARAILKQRMEPDIVHYIAFFLNPQYKNKHILTEEQLTKSRKAVKLLLEDLKQQERDVGLLMQSDAGCIDTNGLPSVSNNVNLQSHDYMNLNDNEIDNELQKYFEIEAECADLLDFWKNALDLPLLRHVSRQILNIPSSCTKYGCAALSLGEILEGGKAKISSESIDQLLFIHKNIGYIGSKTQSNAMETYEAIKPYI